MKLGLSKLQDHDGYPVSCPAGKSTKIWWGVGSGPSMRVIATPGDVQIKIARHFFGIPYRWTFTGTTEFSWTPGYMEVWIENPPVNISINVVPIL